MTFRTNIYLIYFILRLYIACNLNYITANLSAQVEGKFHVGVSEQERLNTTAVDQPDE
jgi:hypothetical protein